MINGGSALDVVHGANSAEQLTGTSANELGIQNGIFWSTQVRPVRRIRSSPLGGRR